MSYANSLGDTLQNTGNLKQYCDNTDGTHLSKENTAVHKMQAIKDR